MQSTLYNTAIYNYYKTHIARTAIHRLNLYYTIAENFSAA